MTFLIFLCCTNGTSSSSSSSSLLSVLLSMATLFVSSMSSVSGVSCLLDSMSLCLSSSLSSLSIRLWNFLFFLVFCVASGFSSRSKYYIIVYDFTTWYKPVHSYKIPFSVHVILSQIPHFLLYCERQKKAKQKIWDKIPCALIAVC